MAWNQRFSAGAYQGRGGYNQGYTQGNNYNQAPYNPSYGNAPRYANNTKPQRKKSGCRIKDGKNGKPAITAWKKTRSSFLTLIACPNNGANLMAKDGHVITNKKGQEYARWTGTIVDRNTGSVSTHSCLYNLSTGKLYIPDLKMVASPNANNGGFWGNSFVSRRR